MDFQLNEEQSLLENSISRFVQEKFSTLENIDKARENICGFSDADWQQIVEMGLTMMPFSAEDGGLGYGMEETGIAMSALGRGLVGAPYLNNIVIPGAVLREGGDKQQKQRLLAPMMEGKERIAFAHGEATTFNDPFHIETTAKKDGSHYILNGTKVVVPYAQGANYYLVSARTSGSKLSREGLSLFIVPADTAGINAEHFRSADGGRASQLSFKDVKIDAPNIIGKENDAGSIIERAFQEGMVALMAEAAGIMDALLVLTVDYLKQRHQFGVAIGTFQALQHKAVDMMIAGEQARSMSYYAMMMLNNSDPEERRAALSAAKAQINKSARFVGQTSVQLHGGIGMTMEYIGAHYFRRLTMIEALFGSTDVHIENVVHYGKLVA
ncbi:acyl-CoA dehydrogenase family protein [uncultured Bartonella sp.]|uniref:acyl-CoA dehydrogenase family protein n=1 Tax=uncultured Bartonella sp. TaxID=104108 RepID=UPI0026364BF0|nr:acyl-CoA dehydrogenase family protein [uncultured Bartonella sp.]